MIMMMIIITIIIMIVIIIVTIVIIIVIIIITTIKPMKFYTKIQNRQSLSIYFSLCLLQHSEM